MDLATGIGIMAAFGMLVWALWKASDGVLGVFWDTSSIVLVVGGSLFVVLSTQALEKFLAMIRVVKRSLLIRRQSIAEIIAQIVKLGELARREGVLSLENALGDIDDEFMANGIRLVIDGTAAGEIEQILEAELDAMDGRHNQGAGILKTFGKYSPAMGMIGTLIGLVAMLKSMDDPSQIGTGMAVALLTTMYGAILANMLFLPLADKLGYRHEEEMLVRTVIMKGVLSLQAGDNPRVTQAKLSVFLPANRRSDVQGPGAKQK
jgi:chemotaxis protein MotA